MNKAIEDLMTVMESHSETMKEGAYLDFCRGIQKVFQHTKEGRDENSHEQYRPYYEYEHSRLYRMDRNLKDTYPGYFSEGFLQTFLTKRIYDELGMFGEREIHMVLQMLLPAGYLQGQTLTEAVDMVLRFPRDYEPILGYHKKHFFNLVRQGAFSDEILRLIDGIPLLQKAIIEDRLNEVLKDKVQLASMMKPGSYFYTNDRPEEIIATRTRGRQTRNTLFRAT